jgi:RNA polymerase sigma-70 factor (ECF subfamily)
MSADESQLTDQTLERLVGAAREGEPEAVRALAHRACTLALRTGAVVLRSREEAQDVAQDVSVDVLRSLNRLREPAKFDAWVHRIAVRHARKAARRASWRRRRETPLGGELEESQLAEGSTERVATRSVLASALRELPQRQRLAIALRYVHDLSDAEIARALGCREGTVYALLSRARSNLRESGGLDELRPIYEEA